MKLYYFYALKVLSDGQGKIKMYYGMSRVKKVYDPNKLKLTKFNQIYLCFLKLYFSPLTRTKIECIDKQLLIDVN